MLRFETLRGFRVFIASRYRPPDNFVPSNVPSIRHRCFWKPTRPRNMVCSPVVIFFSLKKETVYLQ